MAALVLLSALAPLLWGSHGALDLWEMGESKYGLEILGEPVMEGEHPPGSVVLVSSRFKQRYQCHVPVKPVTEPELEPVQVNGSSITNLLAPMGTGACLVMAKDWWTYELCYGRHIRQFHMEGSEVKGDILYLGYYHSAFDWDNETAKVSRHNRLRRYHSQIYVNGTQCDVTGRAREAEVRFLCDEGSPDRLSRVDEPNTCTYILTVLTWRLCQHPSLRPPHSPDPQHIRCHPALSPTHYTQYMETHRSKPRDEGDQDKDGDNEDSTRAQDPSPVPTSTRVTDPNRRIQFKVIRSLQDLLQFMEELKGSPRRAKPQVSEDEEAAASPPLPHSDPSMGHKEGAEEEEEDEEEEEPMGELKEEVKTQMEKEFDSIINEVEQELQSKGMKGEFDPSGAFGLTRLMQRLHREEEEGEGEGRKSRSVGQELQQREEGPIDINVMTSGGDEAEGQWLSEEDTKNLKEIFINVLLRAPPEVHLERRRLRTLQDNYRFVWPPPPMDPEDPDL